jgi:electron transfer flavoprotein alpha subunit
MKISGLNTWKPSPLIRWVRAAPIFDIADYDIVGDLFEAVPVLTEEIKKIKGVG